MVICGSLHLCGEILACLPDFDLLETIRFEPGCGYVLLKRHMQRLKAGMQFFDIIPLCDRQMLLSNIQTHLSKLAVGWNRPMRVRLTVNRSCFFNVSAQELPNTSHFSMDFDKEDASESKATFNVQLAKAPVNCKNPFLSNKTTNRDVYSELLALTRSEADRCAIDDVILYNQHGYITETTIANIAIRRRISGEKGDNEELITPKLQCGLLAGTLREELLAQGKIKEGLLTASDLASADAIYLFNSVRGVFRATLVQ